MGTFSNWVGLMLVDSLWCDGRERRRQTSGLMLDSMRIGSLAPVSLGNGWFIGNLLFSASVILYRKIIILFSDWFSIHGFILESKWFFWFLCIFLCIFTCNRLFLCIYIYFYVLLCIFKKKPKNNWSTISSFAVPLKEWIILKPDAILSGRCMVWIELFIDYFRKIQLLLRKWL